MTHICCIDLVDHIAVGQISHCHPSIASQCHVNGVILHAMRFLVQMDQFSDDL